MKDKDKIYFNACLYAINKLVEKGSRSYNWKDNDGKWHSATWGDTMNWILEKLNAKSEAIPLDKIRAEIITKYGHCEICEYFEDYDYEENDISEYRSIGNIADVLQIIDKYKAEGEDKE